MNGNLSFKYITDVFGNKKKIAKDPNYVAAFISADSHFYIYSLCTKKDFSKPAFFEVDEDTFDSIEDFFDETLNSELVINYVTNLQEAFILIQISEQKYEIETKTIGEMLKLD